MNVRRIEDQARDLVRDRRSRRHPCCKFGVANSHARETDAAEVIGKQPMALQLRFLQSLVEVASEKNSTTIFPVPIDLLTPFLKKSDQG